MRGYRHRLDTGELIRVPMVPSKVTIYYQDGYKHSFKLPIKQVDIAVSNAATEGGGVGQ